jgi:hypothetical protein
MYTETIALTPNAEVTQLICIRPSQHKEILINTLHSFDGSKTTLLHLQRVPFSGGGDGESRGRISRVGPTHRVRSTVALSTKKLTVVARGGKKRSYRVVVHPAEVVEPFVWEIRVP